MYGVYPADYLIQTKIQKKKNKTSARAIIVNTDESFKPGAHWQALFIPAGDHSSKKKRRRCFFFDSYGRPPTSQYIREYIKSVSELTKWNTQQLQAYDSLYCGEWCCVFLACVLKGIKQKEFYDHFSTTDYKANDEKMMHEFCTMFRGYKNKSKIRQICCTFSK